MKKLQNFCMGIKVEVHLNSDYRTFHSKPRILHRDDYIGDYDESPKSLKPILTIALVRNLREIEGVKKVTAWPYEINIEKAPLWNWEELYSRIKRVIAMYYNPY